MNLYTLRYMSTKRAMILVAATLLVLAALATVAGGTALAIVTITATKTDTLLIDNDGDGVADPGDTLRYTVVVTNNGDMDGANVEFSDTIDPNTTLVQGSLRTTPLAVNDSYSAIGNVQISIAAPGVLANDSDPDGVGPAISAVPISGGSSSNGGEVNLNADGSFSYDPPPGFEGADSFAYVVDDNEGNTDTGIVNIAVNEMIWFIDNSLVSNGDGRLNSPFNCLTGTGCFDPTASDKTGDNIFLFEQGGGSYDGGLGLLNGQRLIGQGAGDSLEEITGITLPTGSANLPTTGGVNPSIVSAANGINLAQGNLIRGLNIGNTSGTGIIGSSVGTVTVSETSITGTGGGVDINGGALDITFESISANGATNGILLNNTTGSFTVSGDGFTAGSGGTIENMSGDGISLINSQNVSLSFMNITNNNGNGIFGDDLTGFSLVSSNVDGNANAPGEAGLRFIELLGTATIINSTISNSFEDNIRMTPSSGVLNGLIISSTTIGPNPSGTGNNGITIIGTGTADVTVSIENDSLIAGNQASGILTRFSGTSRQNISVTNSTFTNQNIGIDLGSTNSADMDFLIQDNSLIDHITDAILVLTGSNSTSALNVNGRILNNTIGDGSLDSGARDQYGIQLEQRGNSQMIVEVSNNNVRNTDFEGIFVEVGASTGSAGRMDLTLTGNIVSAPDDNSLFPLGGVNGILLQSRRTTTLCLDIASNVSSPAVGLGAGYRVRQRDTSTFNLERFTGNGAIIGEVTTFVAGQNVSGTANGTVATSFTGVSDGSCFQTTTKLFRHSESSILMASISGEYGYVDAPHHIAATYGTPEESSIASTRPIYASADIGFGLIPLASGASLRASGETINVVIGTLPAGKAITITFDVTVNDPFPPEVDEVANQGTFTGDNFATVFTDDPDTGFVGDPTVTPVQSAPSIDLSITKQDSVDPVIAGDQLTYTINVTNNDLSDATGVVVVDALPIEVSYVSASAGCNESGGIVTCSIGNLSGGASTSLTIVVEVDLSATGGISNNASVSGNQPDPELDNNTATEGTTVSQSCTLALTLAYANEHLTMNLTIGTTQGAELHIFLAALNFVFPIATNIPLPVIDPPFSAPAISFPLPQIGGVGSLVLMTTPNEGVICADWDTVDTGAPSSGMPSAGELRDFIPELGKGSLSK